MVAERSPVLSAHVRAHLAQTRPAQDRNVFVTV